jgi:microcin C transport system permease protein
MFLSLCAEFIANDKPILLKYQGEYYFPIFKVYTDARFGGDFPTEANYKDEFIKNNINENGFMIMPLIEFSYNTVDFELNEPFPAPPSSRHWFGTDEEGRDIVARLLYGIRLSMVFALLLTVLSSALGVFFGAIQGYFGGKVDIFLQRFIEVWESMPQLFALIIIASVFAPTFFTLLVILLLFSWTELTGMVRAEFLRARNFEYVKAAKALGVSNFRIIWRHILPNAMVVIVTFVPFILAGGIVALTALDFLGLGLGYEYPSLGDLVRQGKDNLQAPWIGLSIFFVLSLLLTSLIFIGEGVRDAMDKRR